jgi:hypothetical protein
MSGSGSRGRPALAALRHANLFIKSVAVTVSVAFLGLTLQPLAMAARLPERQAPVVKEPTNEERLANHLEAIERYLDKHEARAEARVRSRKLASVTSAEITQEQNERKVLRQELDILDKLALDDFDKIERHLKDKRLPNTILQRQAEAVKKYQTEMAVLKANVDDIDTANSDTERQAKAKKASDHLKAKQKKKARTKFDPNDLPNKSLRPDPKNKPKLKKSDFTRASLFDNPYVQLAAHGSFRIDQLAGANDPAYLAATAEVTLTPAIQAKAAELEHNPVKIYHWVRNNVEWLPTWGAQQDADVTLGSLRGNAMDIASLLNALLRASDIPARYVHGTIEVPEAKFRNWTGSFSSITAAANYAASGGVPVTTITSGGKITKVQLEHIWVEAAIDYVPSWGAVNKSADTWVALDAAYKQYEDLPGLDVVAIAGVDPEVLEQSFSSSGTTNQQEGWVSGLNLTIPQNGQTQAQTALQNYITNLPDATVGDVIGGRRILAVNSNVLPASLPNRSLLIGARYGTLPAALQNQMTLAFGIDPIGEPINPVTLPWARLNNHKVTLSFRPATAADEQTLASLRPQGAIADPSQLPSSIPGYLITVTPEIAVDGQVVGQGNPMRLGEDLNFLYGINRVGGIGNQTYTYAVAAGSFENVMVVGGSVSSVAATNLINRMQQTLSVLQSGIPALVNALSRDTVLGDMLYGGTLGYFGQFLALTRIQGISRQTNHNLPIGFGTFGYEVKVHRLFGIPIAVKAGSIAMNVLLRSVTEASDGDPTKRRDLNVQAGLLSSALEHCVPEQMFYTPDHPVQAASAVKVLQIAVNQGQRIYDITEQNRSQAFSNLYLDNNAMSEISLALTAGKEVITHTNQISVPGWTGAGYVILDPSTGDGAYKISGGSNGSILDDYPADFVSVALFGLTLLGFLQTAPLALSVILMLFALAIFHTVMTAMITDLHLKDVGCPEGLSTLLWGVSAAFLLLPRVYSTKTKPHLLAIALYNFITKKTINAVPPACGNYP